MKKILLFVLVLSVLASAVVFAATEDTAQPENAPASKNPEKVLARVEGKEIMEKDVDRLLESAGPQVAMMYDNEPGRKMILQEIISGALFELSARKQGLDETSEFKSAIVDFSTQYLARAAIEQAIKDITVSDEDCKKFYDENPDQFTSPEQIRAMHILLADDVTSADKVLLIQEELKKGVSFDVLAKAHSIDPSAQQNGGDLSFFSKGQMVPEFEEAAFALNEPGDISEPTKSDFGWHIIKLEEKKPSSVVPYDDVKPQIEQYLSNEKKSGKYDEVLEALKKEYKVEILE